MAAADHSALQRAVFETLSTNAALCAALPGGAQSIAAFMHAPDDFPYVVIEGISSQPLRMQQGELDDCEVVCAVYSTQPGGAQARAVLQKVAQAFDDAMHVDDHAVVLCQPGAMQTQMLADGLTYRATLVLRIVLEKEEV